MTVLFVVLGVTALLAVLATVLRWQIVDDVQARVRFWSVKIGLGEVSLLGWLTVDPAAVLNLLNMMPGHVRVALPQYVQDTISVASGVLLALALVRMFAQFVAQPGARK
jgi:hypothetical protein